MHKLKVNHAPYKITVRRDGWIWGKLWSNSEWAEGKSAGRITIATGLLGWAKGQQLVAVLKILGAMGCRRSLAPRGCWVDCTWQLNHTTPKTRAQYGSLTNK